MSIRNICAALFLGGILSLASFGAFADDCPSTTDSAIMKGCVAMKESSGNPAITNAAGYSGLYQFGVAAAMASGICEPLHSGVVKESEVIMMAPLREDFGKYKKGDIRPVQDWSKCKLTAKAKSMGITQFNCCGTYPTDPPCGNTTCGNAMLSSSQNAKDLQNLAMDAKMKEYDDYINAKGWDKLCGQVKGNGVVINRDVLRAMLHQQGPGRTEAFLKDQGNARDGLGTSISSYGSCINQCITGGGKGGQCKYEPSLICQKKSSAAESETASTKGEDDEP